MSKDYYNILGVSKTATKDEIKKAFHKKAHQYHPDKSGGDEAKFKEVNEAYQILSDDTKRSQYDTFGSGFSGGGFNTGQGFSGFGGFSGSGAEGVNFDMGDIFSEFFGGGQGRRSSKSRGSDIHVDVTISLAEAIAGIQKEISLRKHITCSLCSGTGGDSGSATKKCTTCDGKGSVTRMQQTILGAIRTSATCETCTGGGLIFEKECKTCRGKGIVEEIKKMTVAIPAGIDTGQMIRLSGEGEAIRQGVSGDLLVVIHVIDDPRFRREGPHLYTTVPVKVSTAVLGGSVDVETADGKALSLKIPAGMQSGKVFRIPNRGAGMAQSSRKGDLLVTVQVSTPTKLSRSQKKLFHDLDKEGL